MFKIIKITNWTSTTNGSTGTTYVVAYKGRVFVVNSNDFAANEIIIKGNTAGTATSPAVNGTMEFGCKIEVVKSVYTDASGLPQQGLKIMPELGLSISDF